MVIHWWRERSKRWGFKALLNATGALATGVTFVIVGASKFLDGAWIALLLIPIMVAIFLQVHNRQGERLKDTMSH
jgi:peptidoglycan/LPS O-acetylase OafA/YrhL